MKSKVITDELKVDDYSVVEGVLCVIVSCKDYDVFKALPDVLEFATHRVTKSGWNSDKEYACYQSSVPRARIVFLPEDMRNFSGPARMKAENEYADRHQFSG